MGTLQDGKKNNIDSRVVEIQLREEAFYIKKGAGGVKWDAKASKGKSNDCLEPEGRNVSGGCLENCCWQDWWLGLTPELIRSCVGLPAHDTFVLCRNKHKREGGWLVGVCFCVCSAMREREREREHSHPTWGATKLCCTLLINM